MKRVLSALLIMVVSSVLWADDIDVISGSVVKSSYTNKQVSVQDYSELILTSETPLENATVNLETENSWLIFSNIRPADVLSNWIGSVTIGPNKESVVNGSNARVEFYVNGTVVIPHSNDIDPLQVYDGVDFTGNTEKMGVRYHRTLGSMANAIRSFKLKRGYMATMSTQTNGGGYSRVFIADDEDLEMNLPALLDETVSFIRVTKWFYPSKKGWCSSGSNWSNEIEITNSTWYYSWSADKNTRVGQEYVPIKQNKGWPSGSEIQNKDNVNHLLGYNEPDRPEQANATVQDALNSWPELMASGLRLGSPAIADDLGWLYNFIDECDRLNYRVDFVAVHAYWGGSGGAFNAYTNGQVDVQKWYNRLREIHLRTKRPLWITEWNNGANWTNETWPSGSTAQFEKQRNDLEKIVHMLDTCSFVERYSIYNWVEDKRALVLGNPQYLTPAGEFYRDSKSAMAFNRDKEVIPSWTFSEPEISSFALSNNNTAMDLRLRTSDEAEMYHAYIVEEKLNDEPYKEIHTASNKPLVNRISFSVDLNKKGQYSYRIRGVDREGNVGEASKEVVIAVSSSDDIQFGKIGIATDDWTTIYFGKESPNNPISILGTPTNNNASILMSDRIRNSSTYRLQLRFHPWSYVTPAFHAEDDLPYLFLPEGVYDFSGIKAVAASVQANGEWSTVSFPENYFDAAPIVLPTQVTNMAATATSVHLRNVTHNGFEISIRREADKTYTVPKETIHFVALSEGIGKINGHTIRTGFVEDVGNLSIHAGSIEWGEDISVPLIYAQKQTSTNEYASTLRVLSTTATGAKVLNQVERSTSVSLATLSRDQVGWLVIEDQEDVSAVGSLNKRNDFKVYPNPVTDVLFFDGVGEEPVLVTVRNLMGVVLMKTNTNQGYVNLASLNNGYYLVEIDKQHFKIVKK